MDPETARQVVRYQGCHGAYGDTLLDTAIFAGQMKVATELLKIQHQQEGNHSMLAETNKFVLARLVANKIMRLHKGNGERIFTSLTPDMAQVVAPLISGVVEFNVQEWQMIHETPEDLRINWMTKLVQKLWGS